MVVLRVGVKTMAVSPNSPKPDHRSALANRPSRDATSGSAIAACRVRLVLPVVDHPLEIQENLRVPNESRFVSD